MDLTKIPTKELLKEINSRDLLKELGEKGDWLKEKGYIQVPFNFSNTNPEDCNKAYSYIYIDNHELEDIQSQNEELNTL